MNVILLVLALLSGHLANSWIAPVQITVHSNESQIQQYTHYQASKIAAAGDGFSYVGSRFGANPDCAYRIDGLRLSEICVSIGAGANENGELSLMGGISEHNYAIPMNNHLRFELEK